MMPPISDLCNVWPLVFGIRAHKTLETWARGFFSREEGDVYGKVAPENKL